MKTTQNRHRKERGLWKGITFFSFLLLAGLVFHAAIVSTSASTSSAGEIESPATIAAERPESFADLAERLAPTVVNIRATKIEKAGGFQMPTFPEGPFGDFFERFSRQMPYPEQRPIQGAGSGVIFSQEGYILTNNHVVEGAKELTVTMNDQQEYKAEIVGCDPSTDLAVLKIDAGKNLPSAHMGDSEELRVGDWVLAIGNPFGLNNTVTSGIVSAKGRIIGAGPYDNFIQTDASINPGNSGGPLFDMNGKIMGINTAIIAQGQGIGFAIPVNTAKPLIPQLLEKGEVSRGYLGVHIQSMTPELSKALKIEEQKGALVSEVVPDGPAAKAGIERGDLIVSYDNKNVEDSHDLSRIVAATEQGKKVKVTVLRNGEKKDIHLKIGKLSSDRTALNRSGDPEELKWGLTLDRTDTGTPYKRGSGKDGAVVVVRVQPMSPADVAGIHRGDIILEVNQRPIDSLEDAEDMLAEAEHDDTLLLLVKRDQRSFYVGLAG
jgi:serine protease Do